MSQTYLNEVQREVSNVYKGLLFQGCFREVFVVCQRSFCFQMYTGVTYYRCWKGRLKGVSM